MATLLRKAGSKTVEKRMRAAEQEYPPAAFTMEVGMETAEEVATQVRAVAAYLSTLEAPQAKGEVKTSSGKYAGFFALGIAGKHKGPPADHRAAGLVVHLGKMPRRDTVGHLLHLADRIEETADPKTPRLRGVASTSQVLDDGNGMFWFTLQE